MTQPTRLAASGLTLAVAFTLAACTQHENPELQWARAALQRNPNVEVVAVDAKTGVFTLRDKHTGEVQVVGMKELAAAPMSQLALAAVAPAAPAAPAEPAAAPTAMAAAPEPTQPVQPAAPRAPAAKPYTIERNGDQIKVSGPGISVVSAGKRATATEAEQAPRAVDPIICEGPRMLHFDSRDIYVEGDAIVARGGCELYITNSTVVGGHTGVVVQDAIVHIANSRIEGATASFEAGSNARLFVRGSTFQGVPRRDEGATVQDQGGNVWR